MPKLAIYVSKQDMRKLDPWRKKINFSQVFIKALQREIHERQRLVDAPKGKLAAAAAHYKSQLADDSDALIDIGHALGAEHVLNCKLSPESIRRLLPLRDMDDWQDENIQEVRQAVGDEAAALDGIAKEQGIDDDLHPTWKSLAYSGYVQGVVEAWKKVCEEMRTA